MSELKDGSSAGYLSALCSAVPGAVVNAVLAQPSERAVRLYEELDGSILYADIVGFTPLCEGLASEGAVGLSGLTQGLNRFFSTLLDGAILPYDGDVLVFGGDSLTAIFRGDDHPRRAAAAALAAQGLMACELSRLFASEGRVLSLRIGVGCGPVRLLVIGDAARRQLTCAGSATARAMVLQKVADPGCIAIDEELHRRLGPDARVVAGVQGQLLLRGLETRPEPLAPPGPDPRTREQIAERIRVLEPFVPEPLAARLKSTPVGWRMDGELREVVILFAQISGLNSDKPQLAATAEFARSFLRVFRKFQGVSAKAHPIEKGHQVMVLFGLHRPSDSDAERALLSALEATSHLRSVGSRGGFSFQIGIHRGTVYYGTFGSDRRYDITVVSDAVNTASRLAAAAEPFEVVVTQQVLDATGARFDVTARPPLALKGKSEPLVSYLVHGPAEPRAHYVQARKSKRLLVGRDAEVAQLFALADRAIRGEGLALGIAGPGGIGKSALLGTLIDHWKAQGGIGMLSRCRLSTRSSPLAPVLSMFSSFLGLTSRELESERIERIRSGLDSYDLREGKADLMALLQSPRGAADGAPAPTAAPSGTRAVDLADPHARERVLSALLHFGEQRGAEEPVLYVIEDLHLADSLTLDLAARVTALDGRGKHLFVFTYRNDPSVAALGRVLQLQLEPNALGPEETARLVCEELGAQEVEERLSKFLLGRAEGNPGYLLELLRFLRDRGLVRVRAGTVVAPSADLGGLRDVVPASLGQVALARLDDLGEVERRLLRTASAIGQRFPRELLETVANHDLQPALIFSAMKNLEGERLLAPEADNSTRYVFRDEVTRSVAYATTPTSTRRDAHRHIADALERLPEDDPARTPAALAIHRERASQYGEAARWYERAARLALGAGLDEETSDFLARWERCVAAAPDAERPGPAHRARVALLRLTAVGRRRVASETLRIGQELLSDDRVGLLDAGSRSLVERWVGEAWLWQGRPASAREWLERAWTGSSDRSVRGEAALLLARAFELSGEADPAQEWLGRAEEALGDDPYRKARVELARASLMVQQQQLVAAEETFARVQAQARERSHLILCADATAGLAYAALHQVRVPEAITGFREAAQLFRAFASWAEAARCLMNLGQAYLWAGRLEEARAQLEMSLPLAKEVENEMAIAEARIHLGACIALTEDPAAGLALLEIGARAAEKAGWREARWAARLHRLRMAIARRDVEATRRGLGALESPERFETPLFTHAAATLAEQARTLL